MFDRSDPIAHDDRPDELSGAPLRPLHNDDCWPAPDVSPTPLLW